MFNNSFFYMTRPQNTVQKDLVYFYTLVYPESNPVTLFNHWESDIVLSEYDRPSQGEIVKWCEEFEYEKKENSDADIHIIG